MNIAAPTIHTLRGEKDLDHPTAKGPPMVMMLTAVVPIRSIRAGEAFVKGVLGSWERRS